jgi:DNA-binding SARP family transcriptional activator
MSIRRCRTNAIPLRVARYNCDVGRSLRIALCGGLAVERDGNRIEGELAGRQGREVFAYLVLNRRRPVSRDELAAMLWPEQAPRAPEAALNTILARLRRVLGPDALGARGQLMLALDDDSWIDVEVAEHSAVTAGARLEHADPGGARSAAARALELIAGPLLPELSHTWIREWRRELGNLSARLMSVMVRAGLELGGSELQDAARWSERLIEREPFRESAYAMLMEVHAARGDIAEALMVYERLRQLLSAELGVPPSTSVAALHRRLLGQAPAVAAGTAGAAAAGGTRPRGDGLPGNGTVPLPTPLRRRSATPIVDRTQERALLLARWTDGSDQSTLSAISGEPGIGKSTLVAAVARELHDAGELVLYGRAEEDPILPYGPLTQAIRHYVRSRSELTADETMVTHLTELRWLLPELAELPPAPDRASDDPRTERLRLYRATAAVIAHAAADRSVLLVLEDLHWADTDTISVLRPLLGETFAHPIHFVVTYRPGEVGSEHPLPRMLADLRRDMPVTQVALAGLDQAAISELLGPAVSDPKLVARLHERTAGNPFFIEEVVRTLDELGSAVDEDSSLAAGNVPLLPEGVQAVIQDRLRRLPAPTRDALAAAAVLGGDFGLELLEAVIGEPGLDAAIDRAVASGLVLEAERPDNRYRFCHALAREAVYQSLGAGRRASLHLRAARALERRRRWFAVEPAEIARHLAASERSEHTAETISYLREAADRALGAHVYGRAIRHLQTAIDILERDRPQDVAGLCELLLELGEVSWQAADPAARGVYVRALSVARSLGAPTRLAEAVLGIGGRFYATDYPDVPYIQLLEQTLAALGDERGPIRARMLGRLAEHLMLVDPERALSLSQLALETARERSEPSLLITTLLSRHAALLAPHHLAERRALADELLALCTEHGERELEPLGTHWLMYDLVEAGDLAAATRTQARLQRLSDELGQPLYRHSTLVWSRVLDQIAGRFERSEQLSHEALNLAEAAQGSAARLHHVAQKMAVVRDHGGAEQLLETSRRWPAEGNRMWLAARWVLELDCNELGADPERDRVVDGIASLPHNIFWMPTVAWLAEVVAAAGSEAQAGALYELLLPFDALWIELVFDGCYGSVARPLGLLAGRLGRSDLAGAHLRAAIDRHAAAAAPALEARARADLASAIERGPADGTPAEAEALLSRARQLAHGCGATRLRDRLGQIGSAAGASRP